MTAEEAVATLPAASRATAVRVCESVVVVVASQLMLYGAIVSSPPSATPSSLNCTPTTPTLSLALAWTVTVPQTVAPLAGDVIDTMGEVVSGGEGGGGEVVADAQAESGPSPATSVAETT